MSEIKGNGGGDLLRFVILILLFGVLATGLVWKNGKLQKRIEELENAPADTVTVVRVDTVKVDTPVPVHHYIRSTDTVTICHELRDTVKELVFLPREYMVYKDSTYKAVVSGVQPRLDSIEIYNRTYTNTITKTIKVPDRKRWGFGIQAGAGYDGKRVRPFVGLGVQYDLVRW